MKKSFSEGALIHASACRELLDNGRLSDALEYCKNQGIEPPQCSLNAQSANADRLRILAMNLLADFGWWSKRLKIQAAREEAMVHIRAGWLKSTSV